MSDSAFSKSIDASNADNITPETYGRTLRSLGRYDFPNPIDVDPDGIGIIAVGADLAPQTLISAYARGLFPWFNEDEPIAWWCPEPRCVIKPVDYQPSKSLRKQAQKSRWQLTVNQAFDQVIQACSLPRCDGLNHELPEGDHTWIHEEMIEAYTELHRYGFAHSIEVWDEGGSEHGQLIGGLYGLKIGSIYFGESMFHTASNASKLAFWGLMRLCEQSDVALVDCQLPNDHLMSLGAVTMPRAEFLTQLETLINRRSIRWQHNTHKALPVASLDSVAPWQLAL